MPWHLIPMANKQYQPATTRLTMSVLQTRKYCGETIYYKHHAISDHPIESRTHHANTEHYNLRWYESKMMIRQYFRYAAAQSLAHRQQDDILFVRDDLKIKLTYLLLWIG